MARFITGNSFGATDAVTSATLNNAVNNAKISTDSVDGTTIEINSDALRIKDGGVGFAKLTDVIDSDTMSGATDTKLATAESIKAYVDNNSGLKASTASGVLSSTNSFQDLDLSSVVGSNKAMVIMEVFDANANGRYILFRTKGSSIETYGNLAVGASATILGAANNGGTVVVTTDSSGVLEYKTPIGNTSGINYAVQAFQVIS